MIIFIIALFFSPLSFSAMKFQYIPTEGTPLSCSHERIRDLPDWRVKCGEKEEKIFTAHVIIREHQREEEPKTSLEILYWITQPGDHPRDSRRFDSSSFMLRFREKTSTHSFILSQGVENDAASLDLTVDTNE